MNASNFCVREAGTSRWTVIEAGVVRGCVATREDASALVSILEAMADARQHGVAYQHEAA